MYIFHFISFVIYLLHFDFDFDFVLVLNLFDFTSFTFIIIKNNPLLA